jgi:peptide deformylase
MEVVLLGSEVLHQKAEPVQTVDDSTRALIAKMFALMDAHKGVGLAAPQVGILARLFVVTATDGVQRVFINPHIIAASEEMIEHEEGCLSVPGTYANIVRPKKITVQALDEQGKKFTLNADGLLARAIQHENDHLNGVLFLDKADDADNARIIAEFNKRQERRQAKKLQKQAKSERILAKIAAKQAKKAASSI